MRKNPVKSRKSAVIQKLYTAVHKSSTVFHTNVEKSVENCGRKWENRRKNPPDTARHGAPKSRRRQGFGGCLQAVRKWKRCAQSKSGKVVCTGPARGKTRCGMCAPPGMKTPLFGQSKAKNGKKAGLMIVLYQQGLEDVAAQLSAMGYRVHEQPHPGGCGALCQRSARRAARARGRARHGDGLCARAECRSDRRRACAAGVRAAVLTPPPGAQAPEECERKFAWIAKRGVSPT